MLQYIQPIIMPIHSGHGGSGSIKELIGVIIAINIFCISIILIRSIIWKIKKDKNEYFEYSWFEYAIYDGDLEIATSSINAMILIIMNGFALLMWLGITISKMI